MESIGQRIRNLREMKNMTQTELSQSLGMKTYTTVSKWESDDNFPKGRDLKKLSELFGVSSDYLLGLNTNKNVSSIETIYNQLEKPRQTKVYNFADRQLREQKYGVADAGKIVPLKPRKKIPVGIYGRLSAGGGAYNDKSVIETVEVDSAPSKYDMAFVVTGDSMYPTFEDGEVVFVNETQDVFNGQIAAIEINNEAFIKKIYLEGKRMRMVSLNVDTDKNGKRLYPDFYADECDNLFVIGRVIM
ncbi:S24 family peptidase [Enterococcus avium]|uniref:helix-turn-helix domain-containing protein n=1 Tax=Enterococcus TaxID=1350 RepID=UPI00288FD595|nr:MULTISPECIES: S24 family peptidase [Enterococcus]MDT2437570.1 S24 family peptidase [Enterococcus avium]MDT2467964.1 S24 family peptidase [Enterococcus avium]MDT2507358.1 S24 family peptidase [Enterococcus avium]MDT2524497.1 S24 family peptidase [Enterococcus raffinosus]